MIGVILAAGNATRLPNKLLLPTRDYRPLILSSVEYLRTKKVREIRVVVAPNNAVELFLERYYRGKHNIRCLTQADPKGVIDAIMHGIQQDDPGEEKVVIVCGDNIYPPHEIIPREKPPFVVARRVPPNRAKHLVRWEPRFESWMRTGTPCRDPLCLTTPWVFTVEQMRSVELHRLGLDRMEDLLNFCCLRPTEVPHNGWWDIGTYDMFMEYWRS